MKNTHRQARGNATIYNKTLQSDPSPSHTFKQPEYAQRNLMNDSHGKTQVKKSIDRRPFITVNTKGRLGNKMFEYAALLGIADTNNFVPVLPKQMENLKRVFNVTAQVSDNKLRFIQYAEFHQKKPHNQSFDRDTGNLQRNNTNLTGYFQSWKYWIHIETQIRNEFQFQHDIQQEAESYINMIRAKQFGAKNNIVIGIHARRGDFLSKESNRTGRAPSHASYFRNAMNFYHNKFVANDSSLFENNNRTQLIYIVASDAIRWCKSNIQGDNVFYSEGHDAAVDLAILSMCDHMIMSGGTFGWWASFLSNGTVTYDPLTVRPGSIKFRAINPDEYYMPHWIPLQSNISETTVIPKLTTMVGQ